MHSSTPFNSPGHDAGYYDWQDGRYQYEQNVSYSNRSQQSQPNYYRSSQNSGGGYYSPGDYRTFGLNRSSMFQNSDIGDGISSPYAAHWPSADYHRDSEGYRTSDPDVNRQSWEAYENFDHSQYDRNLSSTSQLQEDDILEFDRRNSEFQPDYLDYSYDGQGNPGYRASLSSKYDWKESGNQYKNYMSESHVTRNEREHQMNRTYQQNHGTEDFRTFNFYEEVLKNILMTREDLKPGVWMKLIYMEYDKAVAQFNISNDFVIIDGSFFSFDGQRVGLGIFPNPHRTETTKNILRAIQKGIMLEKDNDGSISATNFDSIPVMVKGHKDPANHCISAEVIQQKGCLMPNYGLTKIFDWKEFESHINLQFQSKSLDKKRLQAMTVTTLSFHQDICNLDMPCWLLLVNVKALLDIESEKMMQDVQRSVVRLVLQEENKKEEEEEATLSENCKKHNRNWAKINYSQTRDVVKSRPLRKDRIGLQMKQKKVNDFMNYSWKDESSGDNDKKINMEKLYEIYEYPIADYEDADFAEVNKIDGAQRQLTSKVQSKDTKWAKVNYLMEKEETSLTEAQNKARNAKCY